MDHAKIEMMFRLMEYDYLTDWEENFVIKTEKNYKKYGRLFDWQFEKLSEIFEEAAGRVEWSR